MVFSEQAKNKAMFDRLTEDINKVTENVQLLTNEMMQWPFFILKHLAD